MRKVMDEMRENMRRANPVEDLVHKTDSPFTALINGHPLPPKFKMPSLDSYDGTRDPLTTSLLSRLRCTFKGFRTRQCAKPFQPPSRGLHECGLVKYPPIQ